jgi:hypothetical protein
MKLFIPPLGTQLELAAPWTFSLHRESRNYSLIVKLRDKGGYYIPDPVNNPDQSDWYKRYLNDGKLCDFTLPAGAKLKVARIYIRAGARSFDSVTFNLDFETPHGVKIKGRFWAKLDDVNKMEVIPL